MRFSIIVPVYNVEEYLKKCLDSVAKQRFCDYEVIIVDDETPDNSMAIAQTYVDADPKRFRIIHQKNKGLGGARNTGVAAAEGEYLVFLDSDDYIHEEMLEILDRKLRDNPCDIIAFNYCMVSISGEIILDYKVFSDNVMISSVEEKNAQFQNPPAAWNKVFLRSFYNQSGVSFPEKVLYEDVVTRILMAKAERIQLCTESLYFYVQRPGSIMNSQVSPRVLEIKQVTELVREAFICDGLYAEYKEALDAAMIGSIVSVAEGVRERVKKHPYQKELLQYLVKTFPDYQSNRVLWDNVKKRVKYLLLGSDWKYDLYVKRIPRIKGAILKMPFVKLLNDRRKGKK